MNALVGYGSSDEEDEEDVLPQRPAKVAKLNHNPPEHLTAPLESTIIVKKDPEKRISSDHISAPTAHPEARRETQPLKAAPPIEATRPPAPAPAPPQDAPTEGPTRPTSNPPLDTLSAPAAPTTTTPFSPYTFTRQRLRELTMPPIPNFSIPDAPTPPPQNSEEAAQLAAVSKQFERFLELKKQKIHFNERLQNSTSLRNPGLLPKLMAFAGIEDARDCYESSLPEELGVPARWHEDLYVEGVGQRE
ncbi:hypothetical protein Q7P36_009155 [Cladosporium allicinum]